MGWPQITIIAMYAAGVALAAALHGQPRQPYSLWSQLFAASPLAPACFTPAAFSAGGKLMFRQEQWFAWFPVLARGRLARRWAWLETVTRERAETNAGVSAWRYYSNN